MCERERSMCSMDGGVCVMVVACFFCCYVLLLLLFISILIALRVSKQIYVL